MEVGHDLQTAGYRHDSSTQYTARRTKPCNEPLYPRIIPLSFLSLTEPWSTCLGLKPSSKTDGLCCKNLILCVVQKYPKIKRDQMDMTLFQKKLLIDC